jgi:hypothetical protein
VTQIIVRRVLMEDILDRWQNRLAPEWAGGAGNSELEAASTDSALSRDGTAQQEIQPETGDVVTRLPEDER